MMTDLQMGYAELCGAASAALNAAEEQRQLVAHAPLVKRIVRQLNAQVTATMSREDMEQIGLLGLLDALRRYGPPDDKFPSYAALRVRGAILDELRRQDWRPRTVRQESHRLRDAVRELTRRLGHEPSEAEIMAALDLTVDDYQEFQLADSAEEFASFDELVTELTNLPSDRATPEAQFIARRTIEQAVGRLDEREQRVVQLYYEFELGLKEIAAVLGLTEARVCQINKGALRKMKDFLQHN
ncbi:MAG: lafS [Rhodocyclaceae bacterium]|nr:lafS [Rhodocyclaceae bacterium]